MHQPSTASHHTCTRRQSKNEIVATDDLSHHSIVNVRLAGDTVHKSGQLTFLNTNLVDRLLSDDETACVKIGQLDVREGYTIMITQIDRRVLAIVCRHKDRLRYAGLRLVQKIR
jgi:hypothetical protein